MLKAPVCKWDIPVSGPANFDNFAPYLKGGWREKIP